MDAIGTGFRMVGDKLLVRLSVVPDKKFGSVYSDGKEIGTLLDIIGPTKSPYGVVSLKDRGDYQGRIISIQ
jgi:rRNA processing protein Gar1